MIDWYISSPTALMSTVAIILAACGAVAWYVPPLRRAAIGVAIVTASLAAAYMKGNRDRAALERRRNDEAVRKVQKKYDAINKRKDTPADVKKRLDRGTF